MELKRGPRRSALPELCLGALALAVSALWILDQPPPTAEPPPTLLPQGSVTAVHSGLPVFELTLPPASRAALEAALPEADFAEKLGSLFSLPGRSRWPFVPATFRYGDRTWQVDVRYRGWNYDHYMLRKKSWRVRFPADDPFFGVAQLNVINPRERNVVLDLVERDLLADMGQVMVDQYLAEVHVNGELAGVQIVFEQPGRGFLERHLRTSGDLYGEQRHTLDPFKEPTRWQKYDFHTSERDFGTLDRLATAVNSLDPEELRPLLDVDAYLDFLAESALTASTNPGTHNWRLYYDPTSARFEVLPWYQFGVDWPLTSRYLRADRSRPVDFIYNTITQTLFRSPALVELYHRKLYHLTQFQGHLTRLLARVDEWAARARPAIYADPNKHSVTHFTFEQRYYSNEDWEAAINELQRCLIVRSDYVARFLASCELRAEVARVDSTTLAIELISMGEVAPLLEAVTLAGPDASTALDLYADANDDGRLDEDDPLIAKAAPRAGAWRFELDLALPLTFREAKVSPEAFGDGAILNLDLEPLPTRRRFLVRVPGEGFGAVDLKARNSLTQVPLVMRAEGPALIAAPPALLEPTARLFELPLAYASGAEPPRGYRLGFYVGGEASVTLSEVEFSAPPGAPSPQVLLESYGPAGHPAPIRLPPARRESGGFRVSTSITLSPTRDVFPQVNNRLHLPQLCFLRVLPGGPGPLPRVAAAWQRDAAGSRLPLEVVEAPALDPFPVHHAAPGVDPAPPAADPLRPRLSPPPPSSTVTWSGVQVVDEVLDLPPEVRLVIEPGTRVRLEPGASLRVRGPLLARGSAERPIEFSGTAEGSWGVVALHGAGASGSQLKHCVFRGGSSATVGGVRYTGSLSVHWADVTLEECDFAGSTGDDGVNCKHAEVRILNCRFRGGFDALDLDMCTGAVDGCVFFGSEGDAIDLSGATVDIRDCFIRGALDKGISIGERSSPTVYNCVVADCGIGIASKDRSRGRVVGCTLAGNRTGVALYRKKLHFGGGLLALSDSVLWGNGTPVVVDAHSRLDVEHCVLEELSSVRGVLNVGPGNHRSDPRFADPAGGDFRPQPGSPCLDGGSGRGRADLSPNEPGTSRRGASLPPPAGDR